MDEPKTFGQWLRAHRMARKLTQGDVADALEYDVDGAAFVIDGDDDGEFHLGLRSADLISRAMSLMSDCDKSGWSGRVS